MVLFLHNRYRVPGGEERALAETMWLARERLGEHVELLERDSGTTGAARAAAGLLRGGLDPAEVARAVERSGADVVHAHNLNPAFGPRALQAARAAGARVVLHLHNYRLVCAVGTCVDPAGSDCVACQGRDTRPGLRKGCRGARAEGAVYAAALAAHAAALTAAADVIVVPSAAAHARLRELHAPLGDVPVHVVPHVVRPPKPRTPGGAHGEPPRGGGEPAAGPGSPGAGTAGWVAAPGPGPGGGARERSSEAGSTGWTEGPKPPAGDARRDPSPGADLAGPPDGARRAERAADLPGGFALVVSRLAPEKAVDVAIDACARAGVPLVIAGDGPLRRVLEARAGADVTFLGRVDDRALAALRAQAGVALAITRAQETFGLAALEAMAAGVPTVATARGAQADLAPGALLVPPDDPAALADALLAARADPGARERARARASELAGPDAVAPRLAAVYAAARRG